MAKKQTRRSISINRKLYERLKAYAPRIGESMSAVTEAALEDWMAEGQKAEAADASA